MIRRWYRRLSLRAGQLASPCRPALELLEDRTAPAGFTVTSTTDSGAGSLRQAILDANTAGGSNTISFNISGSGVQTIQVSSELPALSSPVIIDGTTQKGYAGKPLVMLNGSGAPAGANGLTIDGGSSVIKGLAIGGFSARLMPLDVSGGFSGLSPRRARAVDQWLGCRLRCHRGPIS